MKNIIIIILLVASSVMYSQQTPNKIIFVKDTAAGGGTSGAYTQTITAATHGLGTDINNHNIYSDDGTSYISEVSTEVSINKTTGDVTLTSSSPTTFDGKVTFKK